MSVFLNIGEQTLYLGSRYKKKRKMKEKGLHKYSAWHFRLYYYLQCKISISEGTRDWYDLGRLNSQGFSEWNPYQFIGVDFTKKKYQQCKPSLQI